MRTTSPLTSFGWLLAGLSILVGSLFAVPPSANARLDTAPPDVVALHTYSATTAWEIANLIPVSLTKLTPLLPDGYQAVPASAQGVGTPDQGIVVVANFQALDFQVEGRAPRRQTTIDVAILVSEPKNASVSGVSIPGAFHLYTLAIATDDPVYAASLNDGGMPVIRIDKILYNRQIDDSSGVGTLTVSVPEDRPFLHSVNNAMGYQLADGARDAVFWYNGTRRISILHFHDAPFKQGQALSQVYIRLGSRWNDLIAGAGSGTCAPDPQTGDPCVMSPSLNLRYLHDSGELKVLAR